MCSAPNSIMLCSLSTNIVCSNNGLPAKKYRVNSNLVQVDDRIKISLLLKLGSMIRLPPVSSMISHLLCLCVAGLAVLLRLLVREANAEGPEEVSVSGLNVGVGLNQRLPLAHHGAQFVRRQVHTIEVGEAVLALDILADQAELLE